MSRLARTNQVVFVQPQRDPDVGYLDDLRRGPPLFSRSITTSQPIPGLTVVATPAGLPIARQLLPAHWLRVSFPVTTYLNGRLQRWHLRRVFSALRVRQPIVWSYDPFDAHLVGQLGEKLFCFFVYDDIAAFPTNARVRQLYVRANEHMCRRADVVLTSSHRLYEQHKTWNAHTYCVPNAVDFDHFHLALDPATPVPADLQRLPRPILGFVGWLGHQLDLKLLLQLASAYPGSSVVLVGPDALEPNGTSAALRRQPNVHFLGRRTLAELPGYLKAFDAALIPYRRSGHTPAIYPLKLHEYLAAGRSIIATDLPELAPYAPVVRMADSAEAFLAHVPAAVSDNGPEAVSRRVAVARQNTWDQRLNLIHKLFDGMLASATSARHAVADRGWPDRDQKPNPKRGTA